MASIAQIKRAPNNPNGKPISAPWRFNEEGKLVVMNPSFTDYKAYKYKHKYGIPTRMPANVDIIVNRKNITSAYRNLSRFVKSSSPVNTTSKKSRTKNHFKIDPYDLLVSGTSLAPSMNTRVNLNGIPVVPLDALLKLKYKILENNNRNKNKINSNIKTLLKLINSSKKSTPLKVKTNRKINHNDNFSTPPPITRKKLFF
jgi:hypothetical protein